MAIYAQETALYSLKSQRFSFAGVAHNSNQFEGNNITAYISNYGIYSYFYSVKRNSEFK
jgi:hypothetical protein